MNRRIAALVGALLLIGTVGCALLPVLALPFELLFSLIGGIGKGLNSIVQVDAVEGSQPWLEKRTLPNGDVAFALRGVQADSRFRVRFDVPGHRPLQLAWPEDFPDARPVDGRLHLPVQLELLSPSAETQQTVTGDSGALILAGLPR